MSESGPRLMVALVLALAWPAAASCSGQHACVPPAGGRCAGPEPIAPGQLHESPDGLTLSGEFLCGGRLTATERSADVTVVYRASAVSPGAMSCAIVPLSVTLRRPLGDRTILDGVTHHRIAIATRS